MIDLLVLAGRIARAHVAQHHPEIMNDDWGVHHEDLDLILGGWWIVSQDMGWKWWLGVYSKCPAGQDLNTFPFCTLDAPLPYANLG